MATQYWEDKWCFDGTLSKLERLIEYAVKKQQFLAVNGREPLAADMANILDQLSATHAALSKAIHENFE